MQINSMGPVVVTTFQYAFSPKKRLSCLPELSQSVQLNRHDKVSKLTNLNLLRLISYLYLVDMYISRKIYHSTFFGARDT